MQAVIGVHRLHGVTFQTKVIFICRNFLQTDIKKLMLKQAERETNTQYLVSGHTALRASVRGRQVSHDVNHTGSGPLSHRSFWSGAGEDC